MSTRDGSVNRRVFLQGGGALLVGISLAGCVTTARTRPVATAAPRGRAPKSTPPDPAQVDSWLVIHADTTATLYMGFAELGQGATTALLQVAAEELDLGMDQMQVAPLDTDLSPAQGGTYSSASVQRGRPVIAAAAAHARAALLARAAFRLQAPLAELTVDRGVVHVASSKRTASYGELIGGDTFDVVIDGSAALKPASAYRVVGQRARRTDLRAKVTGQHAYVQHLRLPGMLHARVVRPRGQAAYGAGARIVSVDESSLAQLADVQVVRRGDFLGVLAPDEWTAVRAAQQLRVEWEQPPSLPGSDALPDRMRTSATTDNIVLERGDVRVAADEAVSTVAMRGFGPYQAHAPYAPNCALADIGASGGVVICSSQDVFATRRTVAALLGLQPQQVRVQYADGAGTYGHSCYDDAAQAAALMSQLAGVPVRLQLMRWDEHGWDTYGPPHVGEARASIDAEGRLVAYEYHGWQHNWSQVETTAQLAGLAPATEWPAAAVQGVNALVCGGMYAISNVKLVNHRLPALEYLRAAWLRSPLDLSFAFVSEQAIDQLAAVADIDPYQFRRRNLTDARWLGVLDAAASAADWSAPRASGRRGAARLRSGRGIGLGTHLASYGAAVADVEVDMQTGRVRILRLTGALDAGLMVNPLIVERQIEGQLVQTASRLLLEEVQFDQARVTSLDWQSYPVLRFADCPAITAVVVQQTGERSTGAGEETMAAAAAAIANAFFDATGRRMERFPLTPARVLQALQAA